MTAGPRAARLPLVAAAVVHGELPPPLRPHRAALVAVVDWAQEYLCRPHPELGRRGPVCPYVKAALAADSFMLTVCPGRPAVDDVAALLHDHRGWLLGVGPGGADPAVATVLVLFPELAVVDWAAVVDATQQRLKADYVARGVMVGEFHPGPPAKPGLHNDRFRPLRSPVPMLVLRRMVPTDLAFLDGDAEHFAAYRARFATQVPPSLLARYVAAAERFPAPAASCVATPVAAVASGPGR